MSNSYVCGEQNKAPMEKLTVPELVEKYGHRIIGSSTIDLGWENGWRKDSIDLHRELMDRMDKGSYTRTGPASWQVFRFTVTENGITYTVRYELDSGD
jgi:hypothetical protein